ncbi:sugar phosphate isomerase/epimerase [Streptomyces sp. GESEQ-35]|uniref:sugar phosphate isomerase/epimerase family protein n=1 Tax=Streptomyces sp. GESEQ-35 TaxID=2812657 RepID=UPI001B332DB6|nr:sugar phosphate isomerase/epimerase [Streptomyces sp. GESEQ-35]
MTPARRPLTVSAMSLRLCGFEERVRVASAAGFTGIGLRLSDYADARDEGLQDADLVSMLNTYGLTVTEMEASWDWVAANAQAGRRRDETQENLLHAARALGCRRINLASFFHHSLHDIVDAFTNLCEAGAAQQIGFGLEFLPYAQISHLTFCQQIIEDVAAPNGKMLLDTWHFFRSGSQLEQLRKIDPALITAVQINDVLPVPTNDLKHESRHQRRLPGEGTGQLTELLSVLRGIGFDGEVTVEVFSDVLDEAAPARAAERLMGAATRVLDLAGWPLKEA